MAIDWLKLINSASEAVLHSEQQSIPSDGQNKRKKERKKERRKGKYSEIETEEIEKKRRKRRWNWCTRHFKCLSSFIFYVAVIHLVWCEYAKCDCFYPMKYCAIHLSEQ